MRRLEDGKYSPLACYEHTYRRYITSTFSRFVYQLSNGQLLSFSQSLFAVQVVKRQTGRLKIPWRASTRGKVPALERG